MVTEAKAGQRYNQEFPDIHVENGIAKVFHKHQPNEQMNLAVLNENSVPLLAETLSDLLHCNMMCKRRLDIQEFTNPKSINHITQGIADDEATIVVVKLRIESLMKKTD